MFLENTLNKDFKSGTERLDSVVADSIQVNNVHTCLHLIYVHK
jgi:hypothetical protein